MPSPTYTADLPLNLVRPDPNNHREHSGLTEAAIADLGERIRTDGQLTPIWAEPRPDGSEGWEVIAGHRRLYALRHIGAESVRAQVFEGLTRAEKADLQGSENQDRVDVGPCEEAQDYRRRIDARMEDRPHLREEDALKEVVKASGRSAQYIRERLRLLALPQEVRGWVDSKPAAVGTGHALQLVRLVEADDGNSAELMRLALKVKGKGLTVDQTKERVNAYLEEQAQCSLFAGDEGRDSAEVRQTRSRAAALTAACERIAANTFDKRGQRVSVEGLRGDELRTFRAEVEGAQRHLREVLAATQEALGEPTDICPEPRAWGSHVDPAQPVRQAKASVLGLEAARSFSERTEFPGGPVVRVSGPDRWVWVHGIAEDSEFGRELQRAGAVWTRSRGGAFYAPGGERAEQVQRVLGTWRAFQTTPQAEAAG